MPDPIQSPRSRAEETTQQWLERYLQARLEREGEFYCKCKFIAEDGEYSARELGVAMGKLRESVSAFTIEKWSYTNATTWRVAPA